LASNKIVEHESPGSTGGDAFITKEVRFGCTTYLIAHCIFRHIDITCKASSAIYSIAVTAPIWTVLALTCSEVVEVAHRTLLLAFTCSFETKIWSWASIYTTR
jgi:hypothetical protein